MNVTNHYKSVKTKFRSICYNDINYDDLYDAIYRTNDIVTFCYLFMRHYI